MSGQLQKFAIVCFLLKQKKFPLHFPSPALSLAALSITLHFLSLSWLRAVLVFDDCLKCLPSPFHHESCNFVTLMRSGGPCQGVAAPAAHFISLSISRKCSGKHIIGTQGQVGFEGLYTFFFFFLAAGDFFLQIHALPSRYDSKTISKAFASIERNLNSF